MGRLIPAGTGYKFYRNIEIKEDRGEEIGEEIDIQLGDSELS
jgi:DNA-directed RNA polymerase subunit beta'